MRTLQMLTHEEAENLLKDVAAKLSEISGYFPHSFKFSLVGRDPDDPEGGVIVSEDDYFEVADMLQRVALGRDKTKVN